MSQPEIDSCATARTRLLEAAIFSFAEKGFDGTGIREIAKKANANSALVQYHFGGKEGLYREALKHIFQTRPPEWVRAPEPSAPGARAQAIQGVRDIILNLTTELLICVDGSELDRASLFLVTREMQAPHADAIPLLLEHIRLYVTQMEGCLAVLRPDLDHDAMQNMTLSIYAQIFHLHANLAMIRILRDDPSFPADLQALVDHIADFSLRGLGIPEAFPSLGA